MLNFDEFVTSLTDAYEHLYDIVYLRTQPATPLLLMQPERVKHGQHKEPAWQAHHVLIGAIAQLNPEGLAPTLSKVWRKHRLMLLRYIEGLSPQEVADALSISRRQFYRVQEEAMRTLAEMLWPPNAQADNPTLRTGLLHEEVERHRREGKPTPLVRVIESALSLLNERLAEHHVQTQVLADGLITLDVDEKLFRQLLLGIMDHLVERAHGGTLQIAARASTTEAHVTVLMQPALTLTPQAWTHTYEQLTAFQELATLNQAQLGLLQVGEQLHGFELRRPFSKAAKHEPASVLVVDDNADMLELYRRYLEPCGLQVQTAGHGADALDLLRHARPRAIFLDLMLPEQDGWDILQTLQSQLTTRMIPIIICSVLKQRELALSLGAAQFVEKPFTQATLLAALADANAA